MRKTAFFRIYTHSRFPLCTSRMCITHHQPQLVTLSIFSALFCPFFVKKQILPSTIPMEHFTKAKLTHIFWQNLLESYDIPRLFRRSVQFLSKTVILFLDKHIKIHKSHCSSISSDILWHRIVLFVPRSRISAHTFHFFRRTPAGYCPAPANAAIFPCHTPPRSPPVNADQSAPFSPHVPPQRISQPVILALCLANLLPPIRIFCR